MKFLVCLILVWSSLSLASPFRVGFDVSTGGVSDLEYGDSAGSSSGFDMLGGYAFDSRFSLNGGFGFSSMSVQTQNYYYTGWYGSAYSYIKGTAEQMDLFVDPQVRLLRGDFSPTVGGVVDYAHRWFVNSYYNSNFFVPSLPFDVVSVGPELGLDYRLDPETNIGANVRFLYPDQGASSTVAAFYIKFSF